MGNARRTDGTVVIPAALFLLLSGAVSLAAEAAEEDAVPTSTISGKVSSQEGPVEGATVLARNLASGEELRSGPTSASGVYKITDAHFGYHDIGVEWNNKIYPASQVMNILSERMVANLKLLPLVEGEVPREFGGSDLEHGGYAELILNGIRAAGGMSNAARWGWAGGAFGAAAIIFGVTQSSSSSTNNPSPSTPPR